MRGGFEMWFGRGPAMTTGLAALLIFCVLYAFWPRATVVVSPEVSEVCRKVTVEASTAVTVVDVDGGRVPARAVKDSFTVSVKVPVSGSVRSGATKASGRVAFVNETDRAWSVPKGTMVATAGGVRFRTVEAAVVPPATVRHFMGLAVDADSGMTVVDVEAEEPGTSGNVAAGRITVVVAGAFPGLKVTNPEPTSGGEDKITPAVSPVDLATARRLIASEAAREAAARLAVKSPAGFSVVRDTIVVERQEPTFSAAPFTPSAELVASCRASASALAVKEAEVLKVARGKFLSEVVAGGGEVISSEVEMKITGAARKSSAAASIDVTAQARVSAKVDADKLARELAGKSVREAESLLATRQGVSGFSIYPQADGEARLPRFPSWIHVIVGDVDAAGRG